MESSGVKYEQQQKKKKKKQHKLCSTSSKSCLVAYDL